MPSMPDSWIPDALHPPGDSGACMPLCSCHSSSEARQYMASASPASAAICSAATVQSALRQAAPCMLPDGSQTGTSRQVRGFHGGKIHAMRPSSLVVVGTVILACCTTWQRLVCLMPGIMLAAQHLDVTPAAIGHLEYLIDTSQRPEALGWRVQFSGAQQWLTQTW